MLRCWKFKQHSCILYSDSLTCKYCCMLDFIYLIHRLGMVYAIKLYVFYTILGVGTVHFQTYILSMVCFFLLYLHVGLPKYYTLFGYWNSHMLLTVLIWFVCCILCLFIQCFHIYSVFTCRVSPILVTITCFRCFHLLLGIGIYAFLDVWLCFSCWILHNGFHASHPMLLFFISCNSGLRFFHVIHSSGMRLISLILLTITSFLVSFHLLLGIGNLCISHRISMVGKLTELTLTLPSNLILTNDRVKNGEDSAELSHFNRLFAFQTI